jgi:hypothetical protein
MPFERMRVASARCATRRSRLLHESRMRKPRHARDKTICFTAEVGPL